MVGSFPEQRLVIQPTETQRSCFDPGGSKKCYTTDSGQISTNVFETSTRARSECNCFWEVLIRSLTAPVFCIWALALVTNNLQ